MSIKRSFLTIVALGLLSIGTTSYAAETGPIISAFGCNLKDGKDMDDLEKVVAPWVKAMNENTAMADGFDAILTPFRASVDADFLWISAAPSLNNLARGTTAYMADKALMKLEAQFAAVADCRSGTYLSEAIYSGLPRDADNDSNGFVEMYACNLHQGKTMANVQAVEAYWNELVSADGTKSNVYRWTPFFANVPWDLVYVGGWADIESFASETSDWMMSDAGEASGRAWASIMNCESGLFFSRFLRVPAQ